MVLKEKTFIWNCVLIYGFAMAKGGGGDGVIWRYSIATVYVTPSHGNLCNVQDLP